MSQKSGKRSRRHTAEETSDPAFKMPGNAKNKEDSFSKYNTDNEKLPLKGFTVEEIAIANDSLNGEHNMENGNKTDSPKRIIQTRSRSNTPLMKSSESSNGIQESPQSSCEVSIESQKSSENVSEVDKEVSAQNEKPTEADVLVLEKDEEECELLELQFNESEPEVESEASPTRCRTRRSQAYNTPTPTTPKVEEQDTERLPNEEMSGCSTPKKIDLNGDYQQDELDTSDTFSTVSMDNLSTKALAGSDSTRNADFNYQDSSVYDENSSSCPVTPMNNTSFAETVRCLSSRRTIRPISSDYRKIALKNNQEIKRNYVEVERISVGIKRKNRSQTPDNAKKSRIDTSSGLLSYITNPLLNMKNSFNKKQNATPKCIADIGKDKLEADEGITGEKKWCSIM